MPTGLLLPSSETAIASKPVLESTLGWGLVSVLLFAFMQNGVFTVVRRLSPRAGMAFAVVLVALYAADFAFSMRRALHAAAPKEAPAAPEKELEP